VEAFLTGETLAGTSFSGSQEFRIVPKGKAELTVVPEPSSVALALLGICVVGVLRRFPWANLLFNRKRFGGFRQATARTFD
jgi:hypothetical protein